MRPCAFLLSVNANTYTHTHPSGMKSPPHSAWDLEIIHVAHNTISVGCSQLEEPCTDSAAGLLHLPPPPLHPHVCSPLSFHLSRQPHKGLLLATIPLLCGILSFKHASWLMASFTISLFLYEIPYPPFHRKAG